MFSDAEKMLLDIVTKDIYFFYHRIFFSQSEIKILFTRKKILLQEKIVLSRKHLTEEIIFVGARSASSPVSLLRQNNEPSCCLLAINFYHRL